MIDFGNLNQGYKKQRSCCEKNLLKSRNGTYEKFPLPADSDHSNEKTETGSKNSQKKKKRKTTWIPVFLQMRAKLKMIQVSTHF